MLAGNGRGDQLAAFRMVFWQIVEHIDDRHAVFGGIAALFAADAHQSGLGLQDEVVAVVERLQHELAAVHLDVVSGPEARVDAERLLRRHLLQHPLDAAALTKLASLVIAEQAVEEATILLRRAAGIEPTAAQAAPRATTLTAARKP